MIGECLTALHKKNSDIPALYDINKKTYFLNFRIGNVKYFCVLYKQLEKMVSITHLQLSFLGQSWV
jgi:hypothetical protein